MMNLKLIERQPHWRVWIVAWFSRIMGVVVHVEGIPFGSSRICAKRAKNETDLGTTESGQGARQIGGPKEAGQKA